MPLPRFILPIAEVHKKVKIKMASRSLRRPSRLVGLAATLATGALALTACSSVATTHHAAAGTPSASPAAHRLHVGVILGGGGDSGVAWEEGVLDSLEKKANLTPANVDVVVGTSAGAIAGGYYSLGTSMDQLVAASEAGKGISSPGPGNGGGSIPKDMLAALASTQGTLQERDQRIGALALKAKLPITSDQLVSFASSLLPSQQWPKLDFRPTAVNAKTGETVLWNSNDGVPLAAAIASSTAVPGFMPVIQINGQGYLDAPRTSFSEQLVAEKHLDAIVYIGMPTPNLSNTIEEGALAKLQAGGLRVVKITGGQGTDKLEQDPLDPKIEPLAAQLGLRDGAEAASSVAGLFQH
jgi:NTE family protein